MTNSLQRQSEVITALRFLVMLLVVFAHIPFSDDYNKALDFIIPQNSHDWYYYITKVISFTLAHASVQTFFVFSGYYMFAKPKDWLSRELYVKEMKKRVTTLLIPFLIWCTIPLIIVIAKDFILMFLGKASSQLPNTIEGWGDYLFHAYISGPINMPLYYLRDLIFLSLLAPIYHLIGKHAPWIIILLYGCYFMRIETPIVSIMAYLFFGVGAVSAIRGWNMLAIVERYRGWLLPIFVIMTLVIPFVFGSPMQMPIIYLYIPIAIASYLCIGGIIRDHSPKIYNICLATYPSLFLIYVVHEVVILPSIRGVFYKLGFLETPWGYFLCGGLVWLVSLLIYKVLERFTPKLLAVLVGGRG